MDNLNDITYTTVNINNVLLFNYLNNNNYSYNDVQNNYKLLQITFTTISTKMTCNSSNIMVIMCNNSKHTNHNNIDNNEKMCPLLYCINPDPQ